MKLRQLMNLCLASSVVTVATPAGAFTRESATTTCASSSNPAHLILPVGASPMTGSLTVVPVYFGVPYSSSPSSMQTQNRTFFNTGMPALSWLGQVYGTGTVTTVASDVNITNPGTFCTYSVPGCPQGATSQSSSTALSANVIGTELAWQQRHTSGFPQNDPAHTVWLIYLSWPFVGKESAPGANDVCGFSGYANVGTDSASGTAYHLAVTYDQTDISATSPYLGCFGSLNTQTVVSNSMASLYVHEIAESVTQGWKFPTAPTGQDCGQIGDLCQNNDVTKITYSDSSGNSWQVQPLWSNRANACVGATPGAAGDIDGDGLADLAQTGLSIIGWNPPFSAAIRVGLFTQGTNTFSSVDVTSGDVSDFQGWGKTAGAYPLLADFNGDGFADIALTGPTGWGSIPVAFSSGGCGGATTCSGGTNISFNVQNHTGAAGSNSWPANDYFPYYASITSMPGVTGDFDGDGRSDIALSGGSGWQSIPIAFSTGTGGFVATNSSGGGNATFASDAQQSGAQLVAGDFNGDGFSDLALVGGSNFGTTIIVATSNGIDSSGNRTGTFTVTAQTVYTGYNSGVASGEMTWLCSSGGGSGIAVAGDFNGDGLTDIALTGGSSWNTIPVAYSNKGSFWFANHTDSQNTSGSMPTSYYANTTPLQVVAGDFFGRGYSGLALTGVSSWASLPLAIPNGTIGWNDWNNSSSQFASSAGGTGVKVASVSMHRR